MNSGPGLITAIALLLVGTQGHAQTIFINGNRLVDQMRQYEQAERNDQNANMFSAGNYVGYVLGVADAHTGISWCPRKEMTVGQVASTVSKYMNNIPALWDLHADILVLNALQQAFPCKK